ncbi:MAG: response regulator transcription factor [Thermoflexales bacterium]|nr:response regulator transcription factor [Thermoflexales bacterium]
MSLEGYRILLADDEKALTDYLAPILNRAGFSVIVVHDGNTALRYVTEKHPDLIVLDVLMPGLDGREVCRRLRAAGDWTPIIMLTQVNTTVDKVLSLEEGADDYLCKPFDPHELVARVRAVLRRRQVLANQPPLIRASRLRSGNLILDRRTRRAYLGGQMLELTPKALALLEYLMLHPDEVLTRERLLDAVWGWDYPVATRAVDARIAEIRRALGDDPESPNFIETIVGIGYRFLAPVEPLEDGR